MELVGGEILTRCCEDIVHLKWLRCGVPWVDVESYFLGDDIPVLPVKASEELCIEVISRKVAILSQGNSKSEEVSVILHDIAFIPNVGLS